MAAATQHEACIVEYEKCTKLKRIEGTTTEVNGIVSVHLGGALNSDHFQANDWHRAGSMSPPTHFPRLPLFTSFLKCRHSPNPLTLLVAVATVDKQQQPQAATSVVKPSISDRYRYNYRYRYLVFKLRRCLHSYFPLFPTFCWFSSSASCGRKLSIVIQPSLQGEAKVEGVWKVQSL